MGSWYVLTPTAHFGYPQPEASWELVTHGAGACLRCGIAPDQIAPFRVRREPGAAHSDFLLLNWVFSEFFARPHVSADLAAAEITGVEFGPVVRHRTNAPIESLVQLKINGLLPVAGSLEGLQAVTCGPNNEESHVRYAPSAGARRYAEDYPYCARVKYHPTLSLRLQARALTNAPDLWRSVEWFGSGGQAFRYVLASDRFVALAVARRWRGIQWREVGVS